MDKLEHRPTARVLNILELLATKQDGFTLTEISGIMSAPKSTILPILQTMVQKKFVNLNIITYKYTLGLNTFFIGSSFVQNIDTIEFIKSEMRTIVLTVNEICQMGILDGSDILYLAKIDSENPIRIISHVGKKLPAYCTALGKALIFNKSLDELKELYPNELKAFTNKTVASLEKLERQLQITKATMIATEEGEINEHTFCIAVPLLKNNKILAAISVSIPIFTYSDEKKEKIISSLLKAKKSIEIFFETNDNVEYELYSRNQFS